jgi:hypothetical protein
VPNQLTPSCAVDTIFPFVRHVWVARTQSAQVTGAALARCCSGSVHVHDAGDEEGFKIFSKERRFITS